MAQTVPRERRNARVYMVTTPSRRSRWDELAARRNVTLTRWIEDVLDREADQHLNAAARPKVTR
jgi:hypothetical protein